MRYRCNNRQGPLQAELLLPCSCCRAHVEVLNLTLMFLLQVASLVCLRGLRKRLRSWSCSSSWRNSLPER